MIEVAKGIFVGSASDFESIRPLLENWSVLHCCKDPYHKELVHYRGNLSPSHPDYAFKIDGNRMALNLVDMDNYTEQYLNFYKNMFENAFQFLEEHRKMGKEILIHCNLGESRAPTIAMLYLSSLGFFDGQDFSAAFSKFQNIYPFFFPKKNIYLTVYNLWDHFSSSIKKSEPDFKANL